MALLEYDMPLYRPPSEGRNLILQVTLGCSHNECTFCMMYKTKQFRARPWEEIRSEIDRLAPHFQGVERIFLADGDALVLSTRRLTEILDHLHARFPRLTRVTSYATPQNIHAKSAEDLALLREKGLSMLYVGVESGDPETLALIEKGASDQEIIDAGQKANAAGMKVSATVLIGPAGRERSAEHAEATARVLTKMEPAYGSALVMMMGPLENDYKQMMERRRGGPWNWLDQRETLEELRALVAGIDAPGMEFRSNHASNYLPLRGRYPEDRAALVEVIDEVLNTPGHPALRPDHLRAL